jgi:hypothetical protein
VLPGHGLDALPLLRQLVGHLLLDDTDPAALRQLAVYLPRQAAGASWLITCLLAVCAGPAPEDHLPGWLESLGRRAVAT